jgi:hypothetical protein
MSEEKNLILSNKDAFGMWKKFFETPAALFERVLDYIQECQHNPLYIAEQAKKIGKEIVIPATGPGEADTVVQPDPLIEMPRKRAPTWQGLALFCGTSSQYFNQFRTKLKKGDIKDPDGNWQNTMDVIEDIIFTCNYEMAAAGLLHPMLTARYLRISDKIETTPPKDEKTKEIFKIGDMELEWD